MTSNKGSKFDGGKPRMDLIPAEVMKGMGEVLGFGAIKYGDHNWRKGIDHNRLYAATLRHLTAYWSGETLDQESGMSHLAHAVTNLAMMMETPDYDNRFCNGEVLGAKDGEDWGETVETDESIEVEASERGVLGPKGWEEFDHPYTDPDFYHRL